MMAQLGWPELSRKRNRAPEAAAAAEGFEEHRSKRLQCLPLRTSPTARRVAPPEFPPKYPSFAAPPITTITPSDSDDDAHVPRTYQPTPQVWADCPELVQQPSPHVDQDTDMMDTWEEVDANNEALNNAGPVDAVADGTQGSIFELDPTAPNGTGRMPTPINATFVAQVRGNNWGGAAGNVMSRSALANCSAFRRNAEMGAQHARNMMEDVSCSLEGSKSSGAIMADWRMMQTRRIPSPISESGGEENLDSPCMGLGPSSTACASGLRAGRHHGHLVHPMLAGLPPRSSSPMDLGQSPRNPHEDTPTAVLDDSAMDAEPPSTPSPNKKGHTRSRHTLNSWTAAQPGMKKSFSIGYRADCDKCRLKVPGHFNHIIMS